jgi:hypothetical protein
MLNLSGVWYESVLFTSSDLSSPCLSNVLVKCVTQENVVDA